MYDDSAGAMYEQEEYELKKLRRKKMLLIRRIVVVTVLSLVAIYTILNLIDQARFKKGLNPLITLKVVTKNYNDGTVTTKYSIGWVFREYNRVSLKDTEMVALWKGIRQDYDASVIVSEALPTVITDYEVPENLDRSEKVEGVLFFYSDSELLGTYKCVLSDSDCEISTSYVFNEEDSSVKMSIADKRYAFIKEYQNKGTEEETYTNYLYDIYNKVLISSFEEVHYMKIENGYGIIDSSKYIVRKDGLWGIEQVVNGKITNILNYEYYAINYSINSNKYILKVDGGYKIYDALLNNLSEVITEKIDDLISYNGINYYTVKVPSDSGYTYQVYNASNNEALLQEEASYVKLKDTYIEFVLDNKLYLYSYEGIDLLNTEIPLYFDTYSGDGILAYSITTLKDQLKIDTPWSNENTHFVSVYYFDTVTYEFIRKIEKVKETID